MEKLEELYVLDAETARTRTIVAIKKKFQEEINICNKRIEQAADEGLRSVVVNESDIPNLTSVGSYLAWFYKQHGYAIEWLSKENRLNFIWNGLNLGNI